MTLQLARPDRERFAEVLRNRIKRGDAVTHFAYEPGDMTHYEFVIVRLDTHPRAAATYAMPGVTDDLLPGPMHLHWNMAHDRWLLASDDMGAMTVDLGHGHYTDASYVHEKLTGMAGRLAMGSAIVIAELLNMVTECPYVDDLRRQWPQVFGPIDQAGERTA